MKKKTAFGADQFFNKTPKLWKALGYGLLYVGGGESIHAIINDSPKWYVVTVIAMAVIGKTLTSFFGESSLNDLSNGQ